MMHMVDRKTEHSRAMLVQARGETFESPKELLEAVGIFDLTQQNITTFLVRPEPSLLLSHSISKLSRVSEGNVEDTIGRGSTACKGSWWKSWWQG